jgi:hypothetical protein
MSLTMTVELKVHNVLSTSPMAMISLLRYLWNQSNVGRENIAYWNSVLLSFYLIRYLWNQGKVRLKIKPYFSNDIYTRIWRHYLTKKLHFLWISNSQCFIQIQWSIYLIGCLWNQSNVGRKKILNWYLHCYSKLLSFYFIRNLLNQSNVSRKTMVT